MHTFQHESASTKQQLRPIHRNFHTRVDDLCGNRRDVYQSSVKQRHTINNCNDVRLRVASAKKAAPQRHSPWQARSFAVRTRTSKSLSTSMIIPVTVCSASDPNRTVQVYAMLDTQSDASFLLSDVASQLGIEGVPTQLQLSTVGKKDQLMESCEVSDLLVTGWRSREAVSLRRAFTCAELPGDRGQIPTSAAVRKFEYLGKVADEMQPLQNVPIAMLIGYNCAKALMPLEVVASEDDGPFAVRTILGWGIVGELPDVNYDDCMENLETKKTKNIERRRRRRQARRERRYVEVSSVSSDDKPKCSGLSCYVFVALLRSLWSLAWLTGTDDSARTIRREAGWTVLRLLWIVARTTRRAVVEIALTPQCDWAEKTSWVLRFGKRIRLRRGAIKPELDPQISAHELLVAEKFVVRSVQCKYFVWSLGCLLIGTRLSRSDCLLKLESNAGSGLWSPLYFIKDEE